MSSISFVNVYLLLIAIPLAVLLTVPYALAINKDNRNGHNIASMVLHIVMAILIAFAAAGTQFVTVMTETDVYVVADVSYSADKNLDTLDEYIADLRRNLPQNTRMGVICFGKNYRLHTRLGERLKSVSEADVDDSETNITEALNYAASLFRDSVIKRIVLITDGKDTNATDTNALKRTVDILNNQNIRVDAIFLDDNITDDAKEVQLTNVEYTTNVYLNRRERAEVQIQSSFATKATVSLLRDGEPYGNPQSIELSSGSVYVGFDLFTEESGAYDYEVRIVPDEDENPHNNSLRFTQNVSDAVNVLFISEKWEDRDAALELFGDDVTVDYYINNPNVPCSIEDLCRYDEIFLSNADVTHFNNYSLFLESVETVVGKFGKSLITLGDLSIQNKTDNELDELQKMLPVLYGNKHGAESLYTIVLDGSLSMDQAHRYDVAKRAVNNLIDSLSDDDSICIVRFYGNVEVVQSPTKIGELNRVELSERIDNLRTNQGTFISLGLEEALGFVQGSTDYADKSLMLITDGLSFGADENPRYIAQDLVNYGVGISVLNVGRDPGDIDGGYDRLPTSEKEAYDLLQDIAKIGGSSDNYHHATTEAEADTVIFDEIISEAKENIIDGRLSWVNVDGRFEKVLEGMTSRYDRLMYEDSPVYLAGFMNGDKSGDAVLVLSTDYQNTTGSAYSAPLYAYRTHSNGKVASFTSSISGDWLASWRSSGLLNKFFQNVIAELTPPEAIDYPFTVALETQTSSAALTVTPDIIRANANVSVEITSPDSNTMGGRLNIDGLSYGYEFAATQLGKYDITVTYSYGGKDYVAKTNFTISYLPEYDSFAAYDSSVLHKAVGQNGAVSDNGKLTIDIDTDTISTRTATLTVPLLAICVGLFAVDIIIRKLKWADIKSLFKKVK